VTNEVDKYVPLVISAPTQESNSDITKTGEV